MTGLIHSRRRSLAQRMARLVGQGLWVLIPAASLGLLAWVPAAQAWWKARTAGWGMAAVLLTLGSVTIAVGMAKDVGSSSFLGLVLIGSGIGGVTAAVIGRRIVFGSEEQWRRIDPHVAGVLRRRERRHEAHRIAETDPDMALELRIGRPDVPRSYDDGGLIDVNNAGSDAIADALGWSRGRATAFVATRDQREGYGSLNELAAMSTISPRILDRFADRIVLLPYVRKPD